LIAKIEYFCKAHFIQMSSFNLNLKEKNRAARLTIESRRKLFLCSTRTSKKCKAK
jgi:hypothetical protein